MTGQSRGLRILPFLDSAEMGAVRRRELDIPRDIALALGRSAVEAAEKGYYFKAGGEDVDWKNLVDVARMAKQSIAPDVSLTTFERNAFPKPESRRGLFLRFGVIGLVCRGANTAPD